MSYPIPTFHHKEVENLYHYDLRIPKDLLQSILDLPKETLTQDLLLIIEDTLQNSAYFDENKVERQDSEMLLHAFAILAEIKTSDALRDLLDIIKGFEFSALDVSSGDIMIDEVWKLIYPLANHQLDVLLDWVCSEDHIDWILRIMPFHITEQIALHHPERREECIEWLREVYHKCVDKEAFKEEYDFWGHWIRNARSLRATSLLTEVREIYEKDLLEHFFTGILAETESQIQKPFTTNHKDSLFVDIFAYYQYATSNWYYYDDKAIAEFEKQQLAHKIEVERKAQIRAEKEAKGIPPENSNAQYNSNPIKKDDKINRNDPCPCGSGKKYKKCCG